MSDIIKEQLETLKLKKKNLLANAQHHDNRADEKRREADDIQGQIEVIKALSVGLIMGRMGYITQAWFEDQKCWLADELEKRPESKDWWEGFLEKQEKRIGLYVELIRVRLKRKQVLFRAVGTQYIEYFTVDLDKVNAFVSFEGNEKE